MIFFQKFLFHRKWPKLLRTVLQCAIMRVCVFHMESWMLRRHTFVCLLYFMMLPWNSANGSERGRIATTRRHENRRQEDFGLHKYSEYMEKRRHSRLKRGIKQAIHLFPTCLRRKLACKGLFWNRNILPVHSMAKQHQSIEFTVSPIL